ncbi:MAG: DNA polymerase [Candidatus Micrarchaeaceae archaeon]
MGRYAKVKGIMTYDSEAFIDDSGKHRLAYGAFAYKRGQKYYTYVITKPEDFFKFISKFDKHIILIHNAKYDLSLLGLTKFKDLIEKVFMDGPVAVFLKDGNWILDSMNFLKASLKELQEIFLKDEDYKIIGVDKHYKEEVEYENTTKNPREWNEYIHKYGADLAKKDALILLRIMEKYYEMIRRGKENYRRVISLPQLAFLEEKNYLREYLKKNHLPMEIYRKLFVKAERDPWLNIDEALIAYKGGRVEAFKLTTVGKKVIGADFNSEYPTVMYRFPFPYAFLDTKKRDVVRAYEDDIVSIAKVKWNCGDLPIIPIVTRVNLDHTQVITQKKEGIDWITSPELEKLEEECDVEILKMINYKAFPIFREFIRDLYEKKKNTPKDNPLYYYYKTEMNSGYGKWGQHKSRRMPISEEEAKVVMKVAKGRERISMNNIWYTIVDDGFVTRREELAERVGVVIAAFVTGYARMYLYNTIKQLGFENVWYCDTDSIFTSGSLPDYLNFKILGEQIQQPFLGNELGSLKIEKEGPFIFLNKKLYWKTEGEGDWVPKGFKKIDENTAVGIKGEDFVVKGVDNGAKVIVKWDPNPFNIKILTENVRIKRNYKEVENVFHEAEIQVKPRLKYIPFPDFWQGYPL